MGKPSSFSCLFMCILLLVISSVGSAGFAVNSTKTNSRKKYYPVELRVDLKKRARALYLGTLVMPSIGGHFEFFKRDLRGNRDRLIVGPWRGTLPGHLSKKPEREYLLSATDHSSGAAYQIIYKQENKTTIQVSFSFKAPRQISQLSMEILKLSGEFFKGSKVYAIPNKKNDPVHFPLIPRPVEDRYIFKDKRNITIQSSVCDIEIYDIDGKNSINVADFRKISWDRKKSFYFYTNKNFLIPGNQYNFRYAIRFSPPSQSKTENQAKSHWHVPGFLEAQTLFLIQPKEKSDEPGDYIFKSPVAIYTGSGDITGKVLARELKEKLHIDASLRSVSTELPENGIFVNTSYPGVKNDIGIPSEGFQIGISADRITIVGSDERGCLYGAYALLSIIRRDDGKWAVRCGKIQDWPDLRVRGMCIEMLPPAVRNISVFKKYIYSLSKARANLVVFYHTPKQIQAWQTGIDNGGWTMMQMAEVADYARSLHMDVWAGLSAKFDDKTFPERDLFSGSNFYNPFKKEFYDLLFSLSDTILQVYEPSCFLAGHDEIKGLSLYASRYKKSTAKIMADDIKNISEVLTNRHVKTAMWGDMLLDSKTWEAKVGSAHSRDPMFNSGATDLAIDMIPKEIRIIDWHYQQRGSYPSIGYFRSKGFQVIGCTWYDPKAAQTMAKSVKKYGGQGIIGSDWGFWRTLSPAATTLYAPLCGWSTDCVIGGHDEDVNALASILRCDELDSEWRECQPVSLDGAFNETTYDTTANDNRGIFDLGPVLDLRNLPDGDVKLGGISFHLYPAGKGEFNNCIVIGHKRGEKGYLKAKAVIPMNGRKIAALAVLYTCYIEEPQYRPRKLGAYIFEYEDGQSESVELKEGWNITDVRSVVGLRNNDWSFARSPDVLVGSNLVWRGQSASGIPLNLQMMIWKNPHPEKPLRQIDIHSSDKVGRLRIAILGMTKLALPY